MNGEFLRSALLVAQQDLRVRLRTGRWRWMIGAWVLVVGAFTALLDNTLGAATYHKGVPLFGGLMLFVLALALLVSPTLTAQSVNGDRERGTLAPLQVTALSPGQIAVGKLLAGWAVGLVALSTTWPFIGWSMVRGGVGPVRAVVVVTVVGLLIGVVCAVAQALSAVVVRGITSALLSYLTVFGLTVGTAIAFVFSVPIAASVVDDDEFGLMWWLLAPNPFVVLADAAPQLPDGPTNQAADPLGSIGHEMRLLREGSDPYSHRRAEDRWLDERAVWPYGLGFDLALGAGALVVTTRRLRAPATNLPRGVRVA